MKIFNHLLVRVDREYDNTIGSFELATNMSFEEMRQSDDMNRYKRRFGIVEAVPFQVAEKVIKHISPGMPQPRPYVSGEEIEREIKAYGESDLVNKESYSPTTHEKNEAITRKDLWQKTDIRVGDKVYFEYRAIAEENLLHKDDNGRVYMMDIERVFCTVRDGKITTQGGWVLAEADMESWGDITTKSGLIAAPERKAKYLKGFVKHADNTDIGLKENDHIIYARNADFEVLIEGKKLFAIREWDIMAVIEGKYRVYGYKIGTDHFFWVSGTHDAYGAMLKAREMESADKTNKNVYRIKMEEDVEIDLGNERVSFNKDDIFEENL